MSTESPPVTFEYHFKQTEDTATYVVLGSPRGGTSMVSGLLRLLGINMGDEINDANNEDTGFTQHKGNRRLFSTDGKPEEREEFVARLKTTINERNEKRKIWGWKDPISSYYLESVLDAVRNPRLIVVTRDPAAVTGRQAVSRSSDHGRGFAIFKADMQNALLQYNDVLSIVEKYKFPTLFISYERAVSYPADVIDSLCSFTNLPYPTDEATAQQLREYIQPERNTGSITSQVKRNLPRQGLDSGGVELEFEAASQDLEGTDIAATIKSSSKLDELMKIMAANLQAKELNVVIAASERALVIGRSDLPGLKRDPRSYFIDSQDGYRGPDLPNWAFRLYFMLGMALIQKRNSRSAYWCFRTCVGMAEKKRSNYKEKEFGTSFWPALFHQGLAAKQLGWTTEYKLICLRIQEAEKLGLEPDSIALAVEPNEYQKYLARVRSGV